MSLSFFIKKLHQHLLLPLLCFILLLLYGCGYKFLSRESPTASTSTGACAVKEIIVNNKTYLPGLEDRLIHILSNELLKRGCDLNNEEGSTIYAIIRDFDMTVQAERSNQIALYEINMRIEFNLLRPDGKGLKKTLASPFITDFRSGARIEDILLARDREIDKTIKDISVELIDEYISFLRRD